MKCYNNKNIIFIIKKIGHPGKYVFEKVKIFKNRRYYHST